MTLHNLRPFQGGSKTLEIASTPRAKLWNKLTAWKLLLLRSLIFIKRCVIRVHRNCGHDSNYLVVPPVTYAVCNIVNINTCYGFCYYWLCRKLWLLLSIAIYVVFQYTCNFDTHLLTSYTMKLLWNTYLLLLCCTTT